MAKPKSENWELGDKFASIRVNESDALSNLLTSIEENRGEFIRQALMKYYEGQLLIPCPTCEGEGSIYSGTKVKPSMATSKPKVKGKAKSKIFTYRADADLAKDLAKEKDRAETIKMSLTVALSRDHVLDCPTCRGVGKIIGGPKVRKSVLSKFSF